MELIPAIDLLAGRVVRLTKGNYDDVTVYADDPIPFVTGFEDAGARTLHVVDLDGARSGEPTNVAVIERVLAHTSLRVQVGGGIRTAETARRWLRAGASRVVLGTAAISRPDMVEALCAEKRGSVVVALDARDGVVAIEGWRETSGVSVDELAPRVESWGAAAILFTNIARDGTREGPDVEGTAELQQLVQIPVIASGGIGDLSHVKALAQAGIVAAVCGRALYSGAFSMAEGLAAAREEVA